MDSMKKKDIIVERIREAIQRICLESEDLRYNDILWELMLPEMMAIASMRKISLGDYLRETAADFDEVEAKVKKKMETIKTED